MPMRTMTVDVKPGAELSRSGYENLEEKNNRVQSRHRRSAQQRQREKRHWLSPSLQKKGSHHNHTKKLRLNEWKNASPTRPVASFCSLPDAEWGKQKRPTPAAAKGKEKREEWKMRKARKREWKGAAVVVVTSEAHRPVAKSFGWPQSGGRRLPIFQRPWSPLTSPSTFHPKVTLPDDLHEKLPRSGASFNGPSPLREILDIISNKFWRRPRWLHSRTYFMSTFSWKVILSQGCILINSPIGALMEPRIKAPLEPLWEARFMVSIGLIWIGFYKFFIYRWWKLLQLMRFHHKELMALS